MRISATTLEGFRLWREGVKPTADLIAQIQGQFTPTPRILLGRAYGRVLERPDEHRTPLGYECDGFRFEADAIDPALARIDRRGFFEVKATKKYGPHTVVSRADHVRGSVLSEFKTRVGAYHQARYVESYQWRYMAEMFEPSAIRYLICRLSEAPFALDAIEEFSLQPYPRLHDDCCQLLDAFVVFVRRHALEPFLPDRWDPLEGPDIVDSPTKPSRIEKLRRLRHAQQDARTVVCVGRRVGRAAAPVRSRAPPAGQQPNLPDFFWLTELNRPVAIAEVPARSLVLTSPPAPLLRQPSLF